VQQVFRWWSGQPPEEIQAKNLMVVGRCMVRDGKVQRKLCPEGEVDSSASNRADAPTSTMFISSCDQDGAFELPLRHPRHLIIGSHSEVAGAFEREGTNKLDERKLLAFEFLSVSHRKGGGAV
jgi:hypothetical protein